MNGVVSSLASINPFRCSKGNSISPLAQWPKVLIVTGIGITALSVASLISSVVSDEPLIVTHITETGSLTMLATAGKVAVVSGCGAILGYLLTKVGLETLPKIEKRKAYEDDIHETYVAEADADLAFVDMGSESSDSEHRGKPAYQPYPRSSPRRDS